MRLIEIKNKDWEYVRKNINYDFRESHLSQSKIDSSRVFVAHQQGLMSLYFNENTRQFEEESNADQLKNIPDFF
ncbi:MAG: hypothetical protein ACI9SG_002619 [Maribacter sp.]|jgi:hypothetical protein